MLVQVVKVFVLFLTVPTTISLDFNMLVLIVCLVTGKGPMFLTRTWIHIVWEGDWS